MLSASFDARVLLWDVVSGVCLKEFFTTYTADGSNTPLACHSCTWAPDGRAFVTGDSYGTWSHFGFQDARKYRDLPRSQFFHNDTAALVRDARELVLDQATQQPPHALPLTLCDAYKNAYDPELQSNRTCAERMDTGWNARAMHILQASRQPQAHAEVCVGLCASVMAYYRGATDFATRDSAQ